MDGSSKVAMGGMSVEEYKASMKNSMRSFIFQASQQDIARYKREQMLFRWQLVRDYVK